MRTLTYQETMFVAGGASKEKPVQIAEPSPGPTTEEDVIAAMAYCGAAIYAAKKSPTIAKVVIAADVCNSAVQTAIRYAEGRNLFRTK